jgi:hypothetical protein
MTGCSPHDLARCSGTEEEMMATHGLTPLPLEDEPTGLARLLGRRPKENAYRKIHNLIATTPIRGLRAESVEQILQDYRIERSAARPQLLELYGRVLHACARDEQLSDEELDDLRHLRDLFGLSAGDAATAATELFSTALVRAAADQRITDEEKTRLDTLVERLKLPDRVVRETYKEELGTIYNRVLKQVLEDRRLSPEEEGQLQALAKDLGVRNVQYETATAVLLDRFRLLWRIEQGELPKLAVPIRLQRDEHCHTSVEASCHEFRTVTRVIGYTGPTGRIRIAKGFYWRFGAVALAPVRKDELTQLDTGTLYITSLRLLFDGTKKTVSLPYAGVLNVKFFQDGFQVEQQRGKDRYFQFAGDMELIATILGIALAKSG